MTLTKLARIMNATSLNVPPKLNDLCNYALRVMCHAAPVYY